MDVISYRPDPSEFAWTFGGVPPVSPVDAGIRGPSLRGAPEAAQPPSNEAGSAEPPR